MTGYLYTALWFILAVYLLYTAIRRYRTPILFLLAGFMAFLGTWELIDTLSDLNLKSGAYGWIYRGVAAVVLLLCLIWYFLQKRRQ